MQSIQTFHLRRSPILQNVCFCTTTRTRVKLCNISNRLPRAFVQQLNVWIGQKECKHPQALPAGRAHRGERWQQMGSNERRSEAASLSHHILESIPRQVILVEGAVFRPYTCGYQRYRSPPPNNEKMGVIQHIIRERGSEEYILECLGDDVIKIKFDEGSYERH